MKKLSIYILILIYITLLMNFSYADEPFGLGKVSTDLQNTGDKNIIESVTPAIEFLLGFIGIFAIIFVIKGGFQMMISSGDEEKFKSGKKTLIFSLIGLFIILVAYSITSTIFVSLEEINKIK